jgi:hypothetical protein
MGTVQGHDEISAAGPDNKPKAVKVEGEVLVNATEFLKALDAWSTKFADDLTKVFDVQLEKAKQSLALPPDSLASLPAKDIIKTVMSGVKEYVDGRIAQAVADPKAFRKG